MPIDGQGGRPRRCRPTTLAMVTPLVVLVLAGCSGPVDDEPSPPPTVASTDSSTTSTTPETSSPPQSSVAAAPTLRPLPPEAQEVSEAGALAFLAWWVDMYNYVEATGETDLVFQYSEPGCTFCQNFVDDVRTVYSQGNRIEREFPTRLENPETSALDTNGYIVVTADVVSGASVTRNSAGGAASSAPGANPAFTAVIGLQWTATYWMLTDIGREST